MTLNPKKPLIGVTCDFARVRDQPAQTVIERYYAAIQKHSDACAVLIPETSDAYDLTVLVQRLDGILLTGSPSNVEPSRYGDPANCTPLDPSRDRTTFPLIDRAREVGLPIFGICRGLQEINVAFGGSLRRDLDERSDPTRHYAEGQPTLEQMFGTKHPVALTEGGLLASLFGSLGIEVNSVHHQGVANLGSGLNIEARAPDGLIEAIAARDTPIFGVQWHPEWRTGSTPNAPELFGMFGVCVRGASLREAAMLVAAGARQ